MSTRPFCAECLDPIYGTVHRQPLARDGGMVNVCSTCASVYVDPYKTPKTRRQKSMERQDKLRALNKCINGPLEGDVGQLKRMEHGAVHRGGRCEQCWRTKLVGDAQYYKTRGKQRREDRRAA